MGLFSKIVFYRAGGKKRLSRMPTADDIQSEILADLTHGFSGAEIEHIANEAGLLAIKESLAHNIPTDSIQITASHFLQVINTFQANQSTIRKARMSLTNMAG